MDEESLERLADVIFERVVQRLDERASLAQQNSALAHKSVAERFADIAAAISQSSPNGRK